MPDGSINSRLASLLLRIERGEKRRTGLVVEQFFETSILPALKLQADSSRAVGGNWFRFLHAGSKSPCWGCIVPSLPAGTASGRIIETAAILESRTKMPVLLFHVLPIPEISGTPVLSVDVRALSMENSELAETLQSEIERHGPLFGAEVRSATGNPGTPEILAWFEKMDTASLWRLVLVRYLFNRILGKSGYPVDIDGIFSDGTKLVFLEFKRKDPARGICMLETHPGTFSGLGNLAGQIAKAETGCPEGRYRKIPSYGLDMSHLVSLEICERAGFGYVYMIWKESVSKNAGSVQQLKHLFPDGPGMRVPRKPFILQALSVKPDHCTGTSSTRYADSGSYTKKRRVQIMIPEHLFRTVFRRE